MKKKWWKGYQKNGQILSKKWAKKILLPRTPEFRGKHRRWEIEDFLSIILLIGDAIFISIEVGIGNPSPTWGIEAATIGIGLLMILSATMLIGHCIERDTILMDPYYAKMFEEILKAEGFVPLNNN